MNLQQIIEKTIELKNIKKEDPKIVVGKNKSKVILNPVHQESLLKKARSIIKEKKVYVKETKADKVGQYYSDAELSKAYNQPYEVLNDPDAPSSLKDLAYRVLNVRIGENIDESRIDTIINDRTGDQTKLLKAKQKAQDWHKENPIHHENIVKHFDQATDDEISNGMDWYKNAHETSKAVSNFHKIPHKTMAGLVAIYSPQTQWATNLLNASQVAKGKKGVGGPGSGMMASTQQKNAADRVLNGEHHSEVLKGHKIKAFAHLIEHGDDPDPKNPKVVIDRHAISVASGKRMPEHVYNYRNNKSKANYDQVSNAYVKAAKHVSQRDDFHVKPHQMQAVTWLVRQRLNSEEDRSNMHNKQALRAQGAQNKWQDYSKENHPDLNDELVPPSGYTF